MFAYIFKWNIGFRYLAKILAPEGSKDVAVGQPIAITVSVIMLVQMYNILLTLATFSQCYYS